MLFVVFVAFPRMHAFMNCIISHIRGCASRGVGGTSAAVIAAVLHLWRVFRMNCAGEAVLCWPPLLGFSSLLRQLPLILRQDARKCLRWRNRPHCLCLSCKKKNNPQAQFVFGAMTDQQPARPAGKGFPLTYPLCDHTMFDPLYSRSTVLVSEKQTNKKRCLQVLQLASRGRTKPIRILFPPLKGFFFSSFASGSFLTSELRLLEILKRINTLEWLTQYVNMCKHWLLLEDAFCKMCGALMKHLLKIQIRRVVLLG